MLNQEKLTTYFKYELDRQCARHIVINLFGQTHRITIQWQSKET